MELRMCRACLVNKPVTEFWKDRQRDDGLRTRCRTCLGAANAKWRPKNVEAARAGERRRRWKNNYGMAPGDFDHLLAAQGWRCALCGEPFDFAKRFAIHVDHSHEDGTVRGLIHNSCNLGLGLLSDSLHRVLQAARYLVLSGQRAAEASTFDNNIAGWWSIVDTLPA